MPRFFIHLVFTQVCNSSYNSLQAYVIVGLYDITLLQYLQHNGGGNYCRQNDVTVAPCIGLHSSGKFRNPFTQFWMHDMHINLTYTRTILYVYTTIILPVNVG